MSNPGSEETKRRSPVESGRRSAPLDNTSVCDCYGPSLWRVNVSRVRAACRRGFF